MNKGELLFSVTKKDLVITWHSPKGPGGQNKNKTQNACRMRHPDSGVETSASEQRDRTANLRMAFRRLSEHPKFKLWWQRRVHELTTGKTVEQRVDEAMDPKNLRFEVHDKDGRWVPMWDEPSYEENRDKGGSALSCEHANECPSGPCRCPADCYCKREGNCR